ncbi:unnamed protein product, partial [Polarella glacialis]
SSTAEKEAAARKAVPEDLTGEFKSTSADGSEALLRLQPRGRWWHSARNQQELAGKSPEASWEVLESFGYWVLEPPAATSSVQGSDRRGATVRLHCEMRRRHAAGEPVRTSTGNRALDALLEGGLFAVRYALRRCPDSGKPISLTLQGVEPWLPGGRVTDRIGGAELLRDALQMLSLAWRYLPSLPEGPGRSMFPPPPLPTEANAARDAGQEEKWGWCVGRGKKPLPEPEASLRFPAEAKAAASGAPESCSKDEADKNVGKASAQRSPPHPYRAVPAATKDISSTPCIGYAASASGAGNVAALYDASSAATGSASASKDADEDLAGLYQEQYEEDFPYGDLPLGSLDGSF